MSAFMVSKTHIDVVVTLAERAGLLSFLDAPEWPGNGRMTPDQLGRALWAANAASVAARYPDDPVMAPDQAEIAAYTWRQVAAGPMAALKAIHCLRHQCSSISVFSQTWQDLTLRTIERAAIERLPGYREAPWSIEDRAPVAPYRVIRTVDGELKRTDYPNREALVLAAHAGAAARPAGVRRPLWPDVGRRRGAVRGPRV
jgi:hypothetical protein